MSSNNPVYDGWRDEELYGWWRYMVRSHWAGREARLQREQRLQTVNATWATAWRVGRAGATWTGSSDLVGSAQSRFSQERPGCHTASKCHRCDATSRRENLNRNHRGLLVLLGSAMACTHASDRNKFKSRREGDRNCFSAATEYRTSDRAVDRGAHVQLQHQLSWEFRILIFHESMMM